MKFGSKTVESDKLRYLILFPFLFAEQEILQRRHFAFIIDLKQNREARKKNKFLRFLKDRPLSLSRKQAHFERDLRSKKTRLFQTTPHMTIVLCDSGGSALL